MKNNLTEVHLPNKLPESIVADLLNGREILERGITECRIAHENFRRDTLGLPIIQNGIPTNLDQCVKGHAGCPHQANKLSDLLGATLKFTGREDLYASMDDALLRLKNFDFQVGSARRVSFNPESGTSSVPDGRSAKIASQPIVDAYHAFLRQDFEPLRQKLVVWIDKTLEAQKCLK